MHFWDTVYENVLAQIRTLSLQLGPILHSVINDYFLFTVVGALITPDKSYFFNIGDGFICINDDVHEIGPFPENKPPYPALSLIKHSIDDVNLLRFNFVDIMDTDDLHSFAVATDGFGDYIKKEDENLPGKNRILGSVSELWTNGKFLNNDQSLQRHLNLANRSKQKIVWKMRYVEKHSPLLRDDTTAIVGFRTYPKEA